MERGVYPDSTLSAENLGFRVLEPCFKEWGLIRLRTSLSLRLRGATRPSSLRFANRDAVGSTILQAAHPRLASP
jgi:hypothetical protein